MAITDNDEVTEAPAQPPVAPPGLVAPVLLGFLGAWWASNKASKLGALNTKRYWIAAAISTGVVMLASIVVPLLVVAALAASIGGTTTSNVFDDPVVSAPLTGNSAGNPAASVLEKPYLPEASNAAEQVTKVETYRMQALFIGDWTMLDGYYLNHQVSGWQADNDEVIAGQNTRNIEAAIDDVDIKSETDTNIVADVTMSITLTAKGATTPTVHKFHNTYGLFPDTYFDGTGRTGRWYLTSRVEL